MKKRRQFLAASAGFLAAPLFPLPGAAAILLGADMTVDELCALGAAQAVALMQSGELGAERYAAALLARAERERALNAFISLVPAQVMEHARAADRQRASGKPSGRLHGLPIPVKDSVLTADHPTTAGTKAFADFLVAAGTQKTISTFGVEKFGSPLFTPAAGRPEN